jgi:hypothetical protein
MNYQTLITVVALIAFPFALPLASAEPKAYDIVKYKGKGAGVTVAFEFADGYPNASEIRITESASGKTMRFRLPDGDDQMGTGKMRFVPVKGDDGTKEVLLEMEGSGNPPSTVAGSYTVGGKTVRFTLTKSEDD